MFDLDGTLYRGSAALAGAVEVVDRLRGRADVLYLSNNSSLSRRAMAEKLRALGFEAQEDEAVGSAELMAQCLSALHAGVRFFAVCSPNLEEVLAAAGHRSVAAPNAEAVAVGVDLGFSYAKLTGGLEALRRGARLVVANLDRVFPDEHGLRPGAGAMVGAFRGMGFEPDLVCGKPDRQAIERAFTLWGIRKDERILMIGDQLETDVLGAQTVGVDSALVLTGASTPADVDRLAIHPTYILRDLSELEAIVGGPAAT